jgi:hypothetical protein
MTIQVTAFHRNRPNRIVTLRLTKHQMYVPTGSRYMTRADVRMLFLGQEHAIVRNNGKQIYRKGTLRFRAHMGRSRLRIGCHVWSGKNFKALKEWAFPA